MQSGQEVQTGQRALPIPVARGRTSADQCANREAGTLERDDYCGSLGLGLRKREQLNLRRDQVDFSRNVVVATKTKGRKNREIPMDVLNPEVRDILLTLSNGRKPDEYVLETRRRVNLSQTLSDPFIRHVEWRELKDSGGTTCGPPFVRVYH